MAAQDTIMAALAANTAQGMSKGKRFSLIMSNPQLGSPCNKNTAAAVSLCPFDSKLLTISPYVINAGGSGDGKGGDLTLHEVEDKYGRDSFKPSLKPGQMPGQVSTSKGQAQGHQTGGAVVRYI